MIDQFTKWVQTKQETLKQVSMLLSLELSDEPQSLITDLTAIEAWHGTVGELLAESRSWLDRARLFYLPNRNEEIRESERKAIVDNAVTEIREFRDIVEFYQDSIKQRLMLGESILKFQAIFHERTLPALK